MVTFESDLSDTVWGMMPEAIVAIMGLPGAGKSTIKRHLFRINQRYFAVINTTTRAPRVNDGRMERHGSDYLFTTIDEFRKCTASGQIVNTTAVAGHLYGTELHQYTGPLQRQEIPLVDFDVAGYLQISSMFSIVQGFFVVPNSAAEWKEHFIGRYANRAEGQAAWARRLPFAIDQIYRVRAIDNITYVINRDAKNSAQEINSYITNPLSQQSIASTRPSALNILKDVIDRYGN